MRKNVQENIRCQLFHYYFFTGATGDIPFMDKMLLDFRHFCADKDGRLRFFMDEFSRNYHRL